MNVSVTLKKSRIILYIMNQALISLHSSKKLVYVNDINKVKAHHVTVYQKTPCHSVSAHKM